MAKKKGSTNNRSASAKKAAATRKKNAAAKKKAEAEAAAAAKKAATAKKAAATRAKKKAEAEAEAAAKVAVAEAAAALNAKRKPGLVLAVDQIDSKVSNKLRKRAKTSTAASHITAKDDASKIMKRGVKSSRGAKSTADKRKKAFHKRWLEGANAQTVEEFSWVREFTS